MLAALRPIPFDHLTPVAFAAWQGAAPGVSSNVIIDLAALELPPNPKTRILIPLYNGVAGGSAFWSAVLDGLPPFLSIDDTVHGVIPVGLPALESPHALRLSAAAVVTRIMTGLVRAACYPASPIGTPQLADYGARAPGLRASVAGLLARKVKTKVQRRIEAMLKTAPQWAVAWRQLPASHNLLASAELDLSAFRLLPDDSQRYYADPFLFPRGPQIDVFIEELPYATGRGLISMFTIRADGTSTPPPPGFGNTPPSVLSTGVCARRCHLDAARSFSQRRAHTLPRQILSRRLGARCPPDRRAGARCNPV